MSEEIKVTIKMKDGFTKVFKSEKILPNNISTLVSQLKEVKETINGYLTELINNGEEENVKDEDDFEDDEESDENDSVVEDKSQCSKRIPQNSQSPSKKTKH